jgi:hypothetical protein
MGTQGDAARAGDLYAKALAGGVAAAKDRLATLRREKASLQGGLNR